MRTMITGYISDFSDFGYPAAIDPIISNRQPKLISEFSPSVLYRDKLCDRLSPENHDFLNCCQPIILYKDQVERQKITILQKNDIEFLKKQM